MTGRDGVPVAQPPAASLDRVLHEPSRLVIATILSAVEGADFLFLLRESGLSKGNLSSHISKLEAAGYVAVEKTFRGKVPLTVCRLTDAGRKGLRAYREQLRRVMQTLPR